MVSASLTASAVTLLPGEGAPPLDPCRELSPLLNSVASRGLPLVLHSQRARLRAGTWCSPVGRGLGALRPHWASVEPSKRGGVLAAPGLTLPFVHSSVCQLTPRLPCPQPPGGSGPSVGTLEGDGPFSFSLGLPWAGSVPQPQPLSCCPLSRLLQLGLLRVPLGCRAGIRQPKLSHAFPLAPVSRESPGPKPVKTVGRPR